MVSLVLGILPHEAQSRHSVAVPGASSECSYSVAAASRLPFELPLRSRMVSVEVEEVDLVAQGMMGAVPQA